MVALTGKEQLKVSLVTRTLLILIPCNQTSLVVIVVSVLRTILTYSFRILQQLQQAVEKRNEIIARLSSNLQEALASRDQVQLEAQSLAGQIKALQRQLQQVNVTLH